MHIVYVKSDILTINGPVLLGTNMVHLSGVHCKIIKNNFKNVTINNKNNNKIIIALNTINYNNT